MNGRRLLPVLFVAAPVAAAIVVGTVSLIGPVSGFAAPRVETVAATDTDTRTIGAELFAQQCSSCHGLDGLGVMGRGPSLEHEGEAAADFVLRTGRMPLAAPNLQARSGPVRYSEEQIVSLVEYVGSLGDGPGIPDVDTSAADVGNGGRLYRLNCAACHVASGAGASIGSNRRAPNLIDATPTEVGEAILVGPGSMPVFGSFSQSDMADVAAYIEELHDQDTTAARRFGGAGPAAEGLAAWLIAIVPLIAFTRWIGRPKAGRDHPEGPDPGAADG
ncbi:MAG: c-type cytochrome [Acidimicrobiia bacterium]|nr:c-type cytochrome [Acidimicrobiia bacterium]